MKKKMKRGKVIIGIAMAAIMLASVLAAMVPTGMSRPPVSSIHVGIGDTIFIGEQGLTFDLDGVVGYGDVVTLEAVDEGIADTLSLSAGYTVPSVAEGKYYYDVDSSGDFSAGDTYIFVNNAEITGDIILNNAAQDSIVGKSVLTSAEIVFKVVEINFGGGKLPLAEFKVVVTKPNGLVIETIDGQALRHIDATLGTTLYVGDDGTIGGVTPTAPAYAAGAISLDGMDTGTYKVKIKTEKTNCNMLAISSSEMEFTIRSEELSIEAAKDTVGKGDDIIVKVTGNPRTLYYLIVNGIKRVAPGETSVAPEIVNTADVDTLDVAAGAYPATATEAAETNLAAWIKTGSDGVADIEIDTTGADDRTYTIKVYTLPAAFYPFSVTDAVASGAATDDDEAKVKVVELVPQVSISTDKKEYSPGDVMMTSIRISNPADDTQKLSFKWYLGIHEYDLWTEMRATPLNLPAGYDQTVTVPIPVGNWGTESFCGCHVVSLTDTTTKKVVSVDSAAWIYMPSAMSESKTAEEIAKELKKGVEGVELPI